MPNQETILIVDDTPANLDVLFKRLNAAGFRVLVAQDGQNALRQAAYARPDIILLDVMMPGIDGFETCRRLKAQDETTHIPIVFMTALSDTDSIVNGFEAGAVDYVTKPIEWREVIARIETHLTIQSLQAKLEAENRRLQESEARFRLLAENASDMITTLDADGTCYYMSPASVEVLGYPPAELEGASLLDLVEPEDRRELQLALTLLAEQSDIETFACRMRHQNGSYIWLEATARPLQGEWTPGRVIAVLRDITARKRLEDHLRYESTHDALTGLPNRALFIQSLQRVINRARQTDQHTYAIFFIDLDRFKVINDSMGHAAGDQLLVEVAQRLKDRIPPGDMVARFAGDEFTVLCRDVSHEDEATATVRGIHADLSRPIVLNGQEIIMTTSIGIVMGTDTDDDAEMLVRNADMAMYQAKAQGRAQYEIFRTSMYSQAVTDLRLKTDLNEGFARKEFQVYYQPIVALKSGRIAGAEALVRWQHPQMGLLTADKFVPLANVTNLAVPLGTWVLEEACHAARQWLEAGFEGVRVAVNLSVPQLKQADLSGLIAETLQKTQLPAAMLELELAEHMAVSNTQIDLTLLNSLRKLGIRLALDDFSLNSSLAILQNPTLSTVKLDQSIVGRLSHDAHVTKIATAVIQLARSLDLNIVAEGVEHEAGRDFLRQQHCPEIQGFLCSRAVPAEAFIQLLKREETLC